MTAPPSCSPKTLPRRIPDPVFSDKIERHVMFVPVRSVPLELPLDPNARVPNIRRRVYRDIEQSLLDEDTFAGTFHLKHKGITIVAAKVEKKDDHQYVVTLDEGHGILDGGHTYELIVKNRDNDLLPERQFVKFEVVTGVPEEWIVAIAEGLNTSVQVQAASLDYPAGRSRRMTTPAKG